MPHPPDEFLPSCPAADAKRYEQCVRVFTVFFSALAGLGLKKLADNSVHAAWSPCEAWACFTAAFFLLLRFLFGSANHLWLDFIGDPPERKKESGKDRNREMPAAMVWDCLWLAFIGILAVIACYAPDPSSFLVFQVLLAVAAGVAIALDRFLRGSFGEKRRGLAPLWIGINLALAAAGLAAACALQAGLPAPAVLWSAAGISIACFLADMIVQARELDSADYADEEMYKKRYEQCVRAATVFFSMLMGFGLKRLADTAGAGFDLQDWACFAIALLLLLRFLFGSANHLWLHYVTVQPACRRQCPVLLWDFGLLAALAWLGTFMCYRGTAAGFLGACLVFTFIAAGISLADRRFRDSRFGQRPRGLHTGWEVINLCHAAALTPALAFHDLDRPAFPGTTWGELILIATVAVCLLLLLWDLRNQLLAVNSPGPGA